jgi:type IV fimbrial biogenesis protein FimT
MSPDPVGFVPNGFVPVAFRASGFTLIEMITTISIVAVLSVFAGPSMTASMARHRVQDAASDLCAVLFKARADALMLNNDISVLPIGGNWAAGWKIPDPVNSGKYLQAHEATRGLDITLSGATTVTYRFNGRMRDGVGIKFNVQSSVAGISTAKCIAVDPSGRPYTQDGVCGA